MRATSPKRAAPPKKPAPKKKLAAPKKSAANGSASIAADARVAFAVVRDREGYEADADYDVPKSHVLVAALPIPQELWFSERGGGLIVSVDPKRMRKEPVWKLGCHDAVAVTFVGPDTIETPVASGPAYEEERVPLKLERFMDTVGSPQDPRHRRSKMGGHPFNFNDVVPSVCGTCRASTVWALHLDAVLFDETFGDSGSLYVYMCPRGCEVHSIVDRA